MARRSQCSSAGDNPLDPNYLPPHYREEYRLAIDALIKGDLEGYYGFLQDANVVDFLSRPEIEYIKCMVQVPCQHPQPDRRYVVGGDGDGSSDTYWPIHSDLDAPGLDLGWPQQQRFVGPTEITTLVNPPDPEMPSFKEQVRRMIKNAQQVVAVAMDMFTDVDIFADILNAAMRNVAVYVLLDELNAHHFVAMVNNCRVNLDEIKFLRVRTVSGSTYYCHTGQSFKGQMMNRFILVDCKIVLSGHYSFMWSFEKIHRCIAHVFVGQFVATFDEEFRILFAQSEPLVMENAVPYVEDYGNFPQRHNIENPKLFLKEHLPIENIRAEWPGRSFEDPTKVQPNLFSLRRGESVHSSTDEHLPLPVHATQQFRGEHPFLDQRRLVQGPNNDMGRFRRQGYPGFPNYSQMNTGNRGEQNIEDFDMQGTHFPREQYFSQRAGPESGYEIYRKPRDYSYPQLDQYPGPDFPHEMDDVEPPGGYDHVQRFLHSYPTVEKVPAENVLVPVQSPPRRHSMGQSFPCQTSPTQPNVPEQKHFFNVHHKRQDQKEGLRDWRISSYLTALQHSGMEDMEDLQRSDSFDSTPYDMQKSLGRPCESENLEPRQDHSKLNVQPLDNLSLPEKSLDLQASFRSFLTSNAKQTPATTSESSGNTEGDKPEEPKESNLTREESFRRRPNLAIQRSSRLRHSLIFSSNLEQPTTEDAKNVLSQSSEDDPLKKSAVVSNILEKKKLGTKEPFQWSTLVKPSCDPSLDSATKAESKDMPSKTKEESAVEKGETTEIAQKYSQMEKGLSQKLEPQVTENTQIQPKPSVLQPSVSFIDMNDPDSRLRFFKELAAKRKAELAQANLSTKDKVSKEPEKLKKSLSVDKKEEKDPTLDKPTIPCVPTASLQKYTVGTSQESNTKAPVSQILTDKNLKHKSHDSKMTEEHSSPKTDGSCRAISTSATDAEKIKLKQQLSEEHDSSPNTVDDNSASVVNPGIQLGLHTRPKLLSQLRPIPNISSSELSRTKFSFPSVLRPKHSKLSPTDPTALQMVPGATIFGPSQHPTASETGLIQHSTSAEAGNAKRTDTTQHAALTSPSQQMPTAKVGPSQQSPAAEAGSSQLSPAAGTVTSQQTPAAETGPSHQIPLAETDPSKKIPVAETDCSKQIPAAETGPSEQIPAVETGPSKQIPAAETGPSKQIPAAETGPSQQIPAAETGPSQQIPAAETGPSQQIPAAETGPSQQIPAAETGPSQQIPAAERGPSQQITAAETGPSKQIPATETGLSQQIPAAETGPSQQFTAGEAGPSKQITAAETGPSKQIPATETGLSQQIPAAETGPFKQIPAAETGLSQQIHAAETGLSQQIHAAETGLSQQIPAAETGLSQQIPAAETGLSQQIPAAETGLSQQITAAETGLSQQIPAAETGLSQQMPAAETGPSQQIPAAERGPSQQITAAETGPSKQIPATETGLSQQIPAAETGPSQQFTAGEAGPFRQIPAAETGLSQQIPAAETGLSQQIPAAETGLSQQIPAAETGLPQQIPAAETGLSQQIPAAETGLSQQIPAAETGPSQQLTAGEAGPSKQIPVAEKGSFQQIPAAEIDHSKQMPAGETGPYKHIPAAGTDNSKQISPAEISPSQQIPTMETDHSQQMPAGETGLSKQIPAEEIDHSQHIPAADIGPSQQIPAVEMDASQHIPTADTGPSPQISPAEMDHSQQIPASERGSSQQIPAVETDSSKQIPAAEIDSSKQIPAADKGPSQQIPAEETDLSKQIPGSETGSSQQIPAAEMDSSQQVPAAEAGPSQQIPVNQTDLSKQFPGADTGPFPQIPGEETSCFQQIPTAETSLLSIDIRKELVTTNTSPTTASPEDLSAKQHSVNTASTTDCPPQTSSGVSLVPTEETDPDTSTLEADKSSVASSVQTDATALASNSPAETGSCSEMESCHSQPETSSPTNIAKTNVSLTNTSSLMKHAGPDVSTNATLSECSSTANPTQGDSVSQPGETSTDPGPLRSSSSVTDSVICSSVDDYKSTNLHVTEIQTPHDVSCPPNPKEESMDKDQDEKPTKDETQQQEASVASMSCEPAEAPPEAQTVGTGGGLTNAEHSQGSQNSQAASSEKPTQQASTINLLSYSNLRDDTKVLLEQISAKNQGRTSKMSVASGDTNEDGADGNTKKDKQNPGYLQTRSKSWSARASPEERENLLKKMESMRKEKRVYSRFEAS